MAAEGRPVATTALPKASRHLSVSILKKLLLTQSTSLTGAGLILGLSSALLLPPGSRGPPSCVTIAACACCLRALCEGGVSIGCLAVQWERPPCCCCCCCCWDRSPCQSGLQKCLPLLPPCACHGGRFCNATCSSSQALCPFPRRPFLLKNGGAGMPCWLDSARIPDADGWPFGGPEHCLEVPFGAMLLIICKLKIFKPCVIFCKADGSSWWLFSASVCIL